MAAHHCDDLESLLDVARTRNAEMLSPLDDTEVVNVATKAWGYEKRGQNFVANGRSIVASHAELDHLMSRSPDAWMLLLLLRRHHWDRPFVVANAMAEKMPGGAWTRQRFAAARATLEREGKIVQIRLAIRGVGPAVYQWPPA